jgi:hypothetical protein
MDASQSPDTFIPIIEEVMNIKSENLENSFDETIVLLGPTTPKFLVFAKTFFKNYKFPEAERGGFKGAYTYILLTKTGNEYVAYTFKTEFYLPNIEMHARINNSHKLKVLMFTSFEVLEADNDLKAFEYLNKELQSFLTHVRYDHRSVGLIVSAAKTKKTNDVIGVLMNQAYQNDLLKLFSHRTEQGHLDNLQLVNYEIVQRRLVMLNGPEVVRFITETIQFVEKRNIDQLGYYFYHKHYDTMNGFLKDYNERLNRLVQMIKTRIVPNMTSLEDTFHGFMDGILRIRFDSKSGFPVRLLDHLNITLDHHEREFGRHLLDHADMLKVSRHLTSHADPQLRYQEMNYIENNVNRYSHVMPKKIMREVIDQIKKMKINIGLMIQLAKVDRKLISRTDKPSQVLHVNIVKAVRLLLGEINAILDDYKNKFAYAWDEINLTKFKLMLDLYKAELRFMFVNRNKNELEVMTMNRPLGIFRLEFDVIIEQVIFEIHHSTKTEIGEAVKVILEMSANEFLRKHEVEVFKNQPIERIMKIVQVRITSDFDLPRVARIGFNPVLVYKKSTTAKNLS